MVACVVADSSELSGVSDDEDVSWSFAVCGGGNVVGSEDEADSSGSDGGPGKVVS